MDVTALGVLAVRAFVVVTMASFGLQIASGQLAAVLRRPRLLAAVLAVNLLLVPLVGVALAVGLGLPDLVAIGFVVTACAAGSSYSAKLVELAGGDIRLGVGLMFLLAAVTAVTLGPIAALMTGLLGSATGAQVSLDAVPILVTLVLFQLLPLVGLMELGRRAPSLAARLRAPAVRASTVMLVVACIVVVIDSADEVVAIGPVPMLAMVALIGCGLVMGHVIGGREVSRRRAIALITGQRSASVAYIAVHGLGQPTATATVVAFALVMLVVNLGLALGSRRLHLAAGRASVVDRAPGSLDQAPG